MEFGLPDIIKFKGCIVYIGDATLFMSISYSLAVKLFLTTP